MERRRSSGTPSRWCHLLHSPTAEPSRPPPCRSSRLCWFSSRCPHSPGETAGHSSWESAKCLLFRPNYLNGLAWGTGRGGGGVQGSGHAWEGGHPTKPQFCWRWAFPWQPPSTLTSPSNTGRVEETQTEEQLGGGCLTCANLRRVTVLVTRLSWRRFSSVPDRVPIALPTVTRTKCLQTQPAVPWG